MKTKTVYKVRDDAYYSNIEKIIIDSTIEVDNAYWYFDSFKKAKEYLISHLRSPRDEYNNAIKRAKNLNESDLTIEEE